MGKIIIYWDESHYTAYPSNSIESYGITAIGYVIKFKDDKDGIKELIVHPASIKKIEIYNETQE